MATPVPDLVLAGEPLYRAPPLPWWAAKRFLLTAGVEGALAIGLMVSLYLRAFDVATTIVAAMGAALGGYLAGQSYTDKHEAIAKVAKGQS